MQYRPTSIVYALHIENMYTGIEDERVKVQQTNCTGIAINPYKEAIIYLTWEVCCFGSLLLRVISISDIQQTNATLYSTVEGVLQAAVCH